MSAALDATLRGVGTRFRLYAQSPLLEAFSEPETVWLSPLPGSLSSGPADRQMYVLDAVGKQPYNDRTTPPYFGNIYPPATPDSLGHFDDIPTDKREFLSAHMYGTIRRVIDIWEDYFGARIIWPFSETLELIPLVDWSNAHYGPGFIETGFEVNFNGEFSYFCLNFDVLAHEVGHLMLFSQIGAPLPDAMTVEFRGFHESFSDLVALVSVLHSEQFIGHLLTCTHGNLYAMNELNRIGELSDVDQIRLASNAKRMSHVARVDTPMEQLSQRDIHELAQPLTGALFDVFVAVYEECLVEGGVIDLELDYLTRRTESENLDIVAIQQEYDHLFQGRQSEFTTAVIEARDYLGMLLADTLLRIPVNFLSYADVVSTLIASDRIVSGGRQVESIVDCMTWREIDVRSVSIFA